MPCLINCQTLKMISQVESFLYSDKETPEEGQRIQKPKHCALTYHNKNEDNSPKNYNQNNKISFLCSKSRTFIFLLKESLYNFSFTYSNSQHNYSCAL